MADIEKSIAECCKQLKLSTNFAGQAFEQKGDTPQEYLLNLLTNEIEYRTAKRKTIRVYHMMPPIIACIINFLSLH